jgi:predicted permease
MDNFLFAVNVVLPPFILIAAGFAARRAGFVSDRFWSEANKFVFRFPLPLMLFQNIRTAFDGGSSNMHLILPALAGILTVIAVLLIAVPPLVKRRGACGSLIQGIYRSNFLIYGIPLVTGMYGEKALVPVSALLGTIVFVYNVSAVVILTVFSETRPHRVSPVVLVRELVRNPLILACLAGCLVGSLHVSFPVVLEVPVNEIAKTAAPLALLIMGGEFKFRSLRGNLPMALTATLCKLIIVPLIATAVFVRMGFREMELAALLCLFATPTAVVSFIMAENMGCDGELSAQIVVLTTAFSAFSIFGFIYTLKSLSLL